MVRSKAEDVAKVNPDCVVIEREDPDRRKAWVCRRRIEAISVTS